jgi:hypothetical protein
VKSTVHLDFANVHYLLFMIFWVLNLISKLVPKWRATQTFNVECYGYKNYLKYQEDLVSFVWCFLKVLFLTKPMSQIFYETIWRSFGEFQRVMRDY